MVAVVITSEASFSTTTGLLYLDINISNRALICILSGLRIIRGKPKQLDLLFSPHGIIRCLRTFLFGGGFNSPQCSNCLMAINDLWMQFRRNSRLKPSVEKGSRIHIPYVGYAPGITSKSRPSAQMATWLRFGSRYYYLDIANSLLPSECEEVYQSEDRQIDASGGTSDASLLRFLANPHVHMRSVQSSTTRSFLEK